MSRDWFIGFFILFRIWIKEYFDGRLRESRFYFISFTWVENSSFAISYRRWKFSPHIFILYNTKGLIFWFFLITKISTKTSFGSEKSLRDSGFDPGSSELIQEIFFRVSCLQGSSKTYPENIHLILPEVFERHSLTVT